MFYSKHAYICVCCQFQFCYSYDVRVTFFISRFLFACLCVIFDVQFIVCWFHLQAWEDTYSKWDQATKQILNFPKNKADDGQVSMLLKGSLSWVPEQNWCATF